MKTETRIALFTGLLMSFVMSLFFSGFFTFLALGPGTAWLMAWAKGLIIGWPLGFLLAWLAGPGIRRLAYRLAQRP